MPETPPPGRRPPGRPTRMPPPPARTPRKPGTAPPAGPVAPLDAAYKMVGPVIFGLAIGYFFIDPTFHIRPWGMLGMMFFGLITGFWSLLRPLYFPSEASQAEAAAASAQATASAPAEAATEASDQVPTAESGDSWDQDAWDKDKWKQDDWDRKE